ncbi:hypothetical protein WH47_00218, partial [Habropoda laboriosa]
MSSSGYRGRNFGPRGARSNGPTNGFNGPRFLHPSFNHPRPPHRLPGPEKWIERPNFVPWQQSKNFLPHPQYRGNLQFRPNNRGRAAGGHGIVRFSGPGRPPAPQSCMGFIRNPISRAPLLQEEQVEIKSTLVPQTPLPGSEEERQQKISETADKLKQKLSSITEEEITNFWEDDLSVLPNNGSEEENTLNKGIPELRHEPPELDLTFSDFRDIGRVDCNNSKFETVDNKSNDESQSSFEQKPTDNDKCHEQIHNELLNFECNVETIQLHDDNIAEGIIPSNLNDAGEKSLTSNLDENIANLTSIESVNDLTIEKSLMTLYQMLTSDALPSDNNLQQNNVTHEEKEIETPVIRPRTPSALMSQLIQNIETSPVTNQCAKITTENVSTKDSTINSEQPNKSKTLPRNEHQTEKKGSCTSTCGSDDEETMHHTKSSISRKRKRQRSERTPKNLENKSDCSVSSKDTQIIEKKQVNDATKVTSRKINTRQTIIEQDSSQVSINENKSQKDKISTQQIDKEDLYNNDKIEMLKNEEVEKSIECAKSQTSAEEIIEANVTEVNEESCLTKDNEVKTETSKEGAISAVKSQENKTPERSSIYSDDSTWDSLLQNSSMDDQKKPNTGLALLEETYKKEMAKTRKIKAEARKKKKKRLHNLLQAVNTLTPEEEELPLSALYIKKLHQKRKLLNSLEYQAKQQVSDDPELWKNVVEVINAVAENRTEELYVEQLQEQLTGDTEGTTSDILEENSDSKENKEKQIVDSLILKNTEEVCIDLSVDVKTSCENKDTTNNELKKDNVQLSPSKSQECLSNEHFQKDLEISASSKLVEDISGTSVCEISTNIEENLTEFSAQEALENDNVEINQLTSIDDVDSCCMELDSSNICSDQNTLNTLENSPTKNLEEDKVEVENEELNLQEKICNVEEDIAAQAPANSQSVVTLENVEKSQDDATEYNNDKNTSITSEISSNGDSDFEMEGMNEEKLKDSTVSCERDNNEDDTTEKSSCTPQDEQFISLKEHKESQKRKETERLNKDPSEENNNQNSASVSSTSESTDTLKSEETSSKKSSKRKSSSSRTPLRRSSRYTEEYTKRIKLEVDVSVQNIEQESQEKNLKMQFPSISTISLSSCEDEVETIWINPRKSRGTQKVTSSKKRCTPMSLEIEILHESNLNNEPIKGIKRYKQHTISEMMNCVVKLADC